METMRNEEQVMITNEKLESQIVKEKKLTTKSKLIIIAVSIWAFIPFLLAVILPAKNYDYIFAAGGNMMLTFTIFAFLAGSGKFGKGLQRTFISTASSNEGQIARVLREEQYERFSRETTDPFYSYRPNNIHYSSPSSRYEDM